MRLIDADKVETTAVLALKLQHANSRYYYFYEEETIEKAPTVDAITVEFIEKQIAKYNDWNEDVEPLLKLIEDWRKENEESLAE